jgi:hypothetical protein
MEFMEWRELERVAPTVTGASLELDIGALVLRDPLAPLAGLALLGSFSCFFLGPTATATARWNHASAAPILLLHCHLFVIAACEKKKSVCVCVCVCVCVSVCVCWCVCVCVCAYTYIHMYTNVYAYICMYDIYIYYVLMYPPVHSAGPILLHAYKVFCVYVVKEALQ